MTSRITASIVAAALLFLGACARSPQYYVENGNRYFKEKRYAEAALEYRNAIQKDTSSVEGHYGLGLTQIAQDQIGPAITTLSIVLRLRPGHQAAWISLGDIYLRILLGGQSRPKELYGQLVKIADKLLAADPNSYDGLRFRGHLAVLDGRPPDAREFFSRADRIRPGQPQLRLALADAMARDNLPAEAEQLALEIIEKDVSFGPAYDFLQFQYLTRQRPADAERIVLRKAENNPLNVDFQLQLAGYYLVGRRPEDSERVLQRLLNDSKSFPGAHLRVGDFYLQLGKSADAQRRFEEGLRIDSSRATDYKKRLARLYWVGNRRGDAFRLAAELLKAAPNDTETLAMRASFLLEEGKKENLDQVISDYTAIDAVRQQDAGIAYQLGRAQLLKGHPEQAVAHLAEAIRRNNRVLPPRLLLAEIRASQGRYAEVLRYLDEILAIDSGNNRVRLLRAATLRNLKRFPDARTELTQLLKKAPQDMDLQVELGLLNLAEGRLAEAEAVFGQLYRSKGLDLRPAAGLVRVYSAQHQYAKAIRLLSEEVKKDPSSRSARQALTTVALQAGDVPLALAQLEQIVALDPRDVIAHAQIGQLQAARGNINEGLESLRKAADIAPKDVNVLLAFAAGLQEAGRLPEAGSVLQRALALEPENPVVLNNLAYLYAESGKSLDEALRMARTASQKQPDNRHFMDTLGMVYLKRNMADNALPIFRSLTTTEPNNPTFRLHYGMGLLQKGDHSRARKEFQAALSARNSPQEEKKLRQLLASTDDPR